MIELFVIWFLTLVSLGIGYAVGQRKSPQEALQDLRKAIQKSTTPSGPVMRPTAQKVNLWHNPEKEKEEEAFKEAFLKGGGKIP